MDLRPIQTLMGDAGAGIKGPYAFCYGIGIYRGVYQRRVEKGTSYLRLQGTSH